MPEGERKGGNLTFRTRGSIRDDLEAAAAVSGRSISEEIEHRLQRSFQEDTHVEQGFGDRRTLDLMRLIASIAVNVNNIRKPDVHWLQDPYTFDQVANAVVAVLQTLRPDETYGSVAEERTPRAHGRVEAHHHLQREMSSGSSIAELILEEKLPGRLVSKISDELLPYVDQARAEGRSVLEVYREAQWKTGRRK